MAQFRLCFLPILFLGALPIACSADRASDAADLTQAIAFQPLAVQRSQAKAGLTVLKNGADYRAFFGDGAPGVDFNKHWVVHYSLGKKSHGGFATRITAVLKTGPSDDRKLVVHTVDESPGADCAASAAIDYPQVTVLIPKQPGTPGKKVEAEAVTRRCGELDCGYLDDRASEACLGDDDQPDWDGCFASELDGLGDVRQAARDCCDGSGAFFWCDALNNGNFTCEASGGSCEDEHVGCYDGEVENEDLGCADLGSRSLRLCCVPGT